MENVVRAARPGHDRRVAVAVWQLHPDWARRCGTQASHPAVPTSEGRPHLLLLRGRAVRRGDDAVRGVLLLLGRGRGGVDARTTCRPCGPTCSSASRSAGCSRWRIAAARRSCFQPRGDRGRPRCPRSRCRWPRRAGQARSGARASSAFVAATFGAALETGAVRAATRSRSTSAGSGASSCGRAQAARFHLVAAGSTIVGRRARRLTAVDPIKVTEYSIVLLGGRAAADLLPDPRRSPTTATTWVTR